MHPKNKTTITPQLRQLLILAISLLTTSISLAANNIYTCNGKSPWHAVISLGGGGVFSSGIGQSQTFPIVDLNTDELYVYTANHATQTAALFNSFVGAEWSFNPRWAIQMGLSYNQIGNFQAKGSFLQGADAQSADLHTYQYTVFTRQVLAESKLLFHCTECFHPYILLGLGTAFNEAADYKTNVPPFLTFTRQYKNNTQSSFSYNVGVGIDADVSTNFRLGIGYRFADLGQVKLGPATIDTTNVSGTLLQKHFHANEIIMQITYVI